MEETTRERTGIQRCKLSGRRRFVEFDAYPGEPSVELTKNAGKHGSHRESGKRDSDMTYLAGREGVKFSGNRGKSTQQRLNPLEQKSAGCRDFHATTGSAQEVALERRFELRDGAAQRRLSNRECLRGFSKMQLPRHFAEVNQVAQFEWKLILARHH